MCIANLNFHIFRRMCITNPHIYIYSLVIGYHCIWVKIVVQVVIGYKKIFFLVLSYQIWLKWNLWVALRFCLTNYYFLFWYMTNEFDWHEICCFQINHLIDSFFSLLQNISWYWNIKFVGFLFMYCLHLWFMLLI
jgi:hypothetical protein